MWPVRRWFRLGWWVLCTLTLLALPLVIWDFWRKGMEITLMAWFVGGIFVIFSVPISVYEVAMHTEYYTQPRLQRHVIRILWMVPIYAVDAWFALRFQSAREYLDPVRECYEAYVIWNFYAYLITYLEDEHGDLVQLLARKPPMRHPGPLQWVLTPWPMGAPFLLETKKGVMNYVILRPLTTAIALITDIFDRYGQGHIDWTKSYVYLVSVTNFSQLWALYSLGQMYYVCHKELEPIRPLSKFLCIKAVVFMTFWQGVVLAVLVSSGFIRDESWTTPDDKIGVATGIQDFLICVEMFVAALAHAYAFPPKDYMTAGTSKGFFANVKHMFDLRDVVQDMGVVVESHVDTVTEAVSTTTQAVLAVPKVAVKTAVKTAAKGLKAPDALFQLFGGGGGGAGGHDARPSRRRPQGNGWARARTSDDAEGGDGSDVDLLQDDDPSLADTAALLLPQDNQMQPLSDARSSNAASGGAGSAGAAGAAGSGRVPGLRSLPDLEEGGGGGGAALRGVASAGSLTARGRLEGNGVGGAARARGPGRGGGKGGSSMRRPLLADEPDGGGVWSSTAGPTPGRGTLEAPSLSAWGAPSSDAFGGFGGGGRAALSGNGASGPGAAGIRPRASSSRGHSPAPAGASDSGGGGAEPSFARGLLGLAGQGGGGGGWWGLSAPRAAGAAQQGEMQIFKSSSGTALNEAAQGGGAQAGGSAPARAAPTHRRQSSGPINTGRSLRDEQQQPLLGSQPGSPLTGSHSKD